MNIEFVLRVGIAVVSAIVIVGGLFANQLFYPSAHRAKSDD